MSKHVFDSILDMKPPDIGLSPHSDDCFRTGFRTAQLGAAKLVADAALCPSIKGSIPRGDARLARDVMAADDLSVPMSAAQLNDAYGQPDPFDDDYSLQPGDLGHERPEVR